MPKALRTNVLASAFWAVAISLLLGPSCSETDSTGTETPESATEPTQPPSPPTESDPATNDEVVADVTAVRVSGDPGRYTFAVTLRSADTGCEQYADWWEVVTPDGELIYRRILAHSHVDEQPFTRSGGPVDIQAAARVIVRAHMNEVGYGGVAYAGSPNTGFEPERSVGSDLAPDLADATPLPDGCAF